MKIVPDDLENGLYLRQVSDDGVYEVAIHPVLYGYRIRAGKVGDGFCNVDYCGGMNLLYINLIYHFVATIIQDRVSKGEPPFKGLPVQYTKPMHLDPECFSALQDMCPDGSQNVLFVTPAQLEVYRKQSFAWVERNSTPDK